MHRDLMDTLRPLMGEMDERPTTTTILRMHLQ